MDSTRAIADALVAGRIRLVSQEDRGSRGYVLGFSAATVTLSKRELSTLAAAESGVANKVVAIEQSLACSTVSESLQTAISKLGFASRAEFLKVIAYLRNASRAAEVRAVAAGAPCWVFLPAETLNLDLCLTAAEREVVAGVLNGRSNAAIALARRTSTRTVANQLAAIYRKLGVFSRWELAARAGRACSTLAQAS